MALVVDFTEPSPATHLQIENIFYRSGVALENRVLGLAVLIFDGKCSDAQFRAEETNARRNRFYVGQVLEGHRIFKGQFLACAHLFAWSAERKRFEMKGKNDVRTHAADEVTNIVIQSTYDGRDSDNHGDTDHDA